MLLAVVAGGGGIDARRKRIGGEAGWRGLGRGAKPRDWRRRI